MRVALITTSFPMTRESADGIFVARLADSLATDAELTVITPDSTEGTPKPRHGYPIQGFRYAPRRWQRLAHSPGGIPVALRDSPWLWLLVPGFLCAVFLVSLRAARTHDVIHANWIAVGAIAGLAGRIRRTPVVTTLRGADVTRLERSITDRLLLRLVLRTNDRLIGVSDAIRDQVNTLVPGHEARVTTIPNGVDDRLFELAGQPKDAGSKPLRLITVGSLIPRKSVATILDAIAQLDDTSLQLDVVGDGPERTMLQARISQLGLHGRARLLGPVPPSSIDQVLARGDVFVMASRSEGRPNALLEAMAASLPPVAPAIPGIIELIEHDRTGLLYGPGEASELAACLRRIAGDAGLRARLGTAARRELDERGLRWNRTAKSYLATYRSAVEGA